jgi:hypothetical protein
MYLYLGLPCTCVWHMHAPPQAAPLMGRIGKSGRRVAGRRGEAPALMVEVETSAGGRHRWSAHEREAHARL